MNLTFKDWEFTFDSEAVTAISDNERIVFLTKGYDEIHLVIETESNNLVFHPRWSVNITELEPKKYLIGTNNYTYEGGSQI